MLIWPNIVIKKYEEVSVYWDQSMSAKFPSSITETQHTMSRINKWSYRNMSISFRKTEIHTRGNGRVERDSYKSQTHGEALGMPAVWQDRLPGGIWNFNQYICTTLTKITFKNLYK